jgi:DNA-binding transcriptional MerR regulator
VAERTYLSIGDVLSLLKGEFPDITISKIRFLESQGLLDPERTPSGYRKFYDEDVERLRWILLQQRENFLPLKVIRGRLGGNGGGSSANEAGDRGGVGVLAGPGGQLGEAGGASGRLEETTRPAGPPEDLARAGIDGVGRAQARTPRQASAGEEPSPTREEPSTPPAPPDPGSQAGGAVQPAERRPAASEASATPTRALRASRPAPPSAVRPSQVAQPGIKAAGVPGPVAEEESGGPLSIGLSGVNLTREELVDASGLSEDDLGELERYGLLSGRVVGDTTYFDEESLTVARLAAGFRRYGIEARHLRMYRTAADREASFFEQIVLPILKQRNPVARRRAVETLAELARLGQGLRGSLLRSALRDHTGG